MDAALKLGVEKPYAPLPPVYAHYLERRKRSYKPLEHSTMQRGIQS
jgi:hypothetical protein